MPLTTTAPASRKARAPRRRARASSSRCRRAARTRTGRRRPPSETPFRLSSAPNVSSWGSNGLPGAGDQLAQLVVADDAGPRHRGATSSGLSGRVRASPEHQSRGVAAFRSATGVGGSTSTSPSTRTSVLHTPIPGMMLTDFHVSESRSVPHGIHVHRRGAALHGLSRAVLEDVPGPRRRPPRDGRRVAPWSRTCRGWTGTASAGWSRT